jgi:hypothetical protein
LDVPRPKKIQKQLATIDLTKDDDDTIPLATSTSSATAIAAAAPINPTPIAPPCLTSTSALNPPAVPKRQGTLFQFGARKMSPEEVAAQRKKYAEETRDKMAAEAERDRLAKIRAGEKRKDDGRLRQQKFRDRKTLGGPSAAKTAKKKVLWLVAPTDRDPDLNVAEVSRPDGAAWKKKRTGKQNGVIQQRHQWVNWCHPFLWNPIAYIAPRVGWSAMMIVVSLQRQNPSLYAQVNKRTVQK